MTGVRCALVLASLVVAARVTLTGQRPASSSPGEQFQEAVTLMEGRGNCRAALRLFGRVADGPDRSLAARALVYTGVCAELLGRDDAADAYRRVIDHFPDQSAAVAEARRRLAQLKLPSGVSAVPTPTLRRAWPSRPPDALFGGGASYGGSVMAYVTNEGGIALADLATGARLRMVLRPAEGSVSPKPVPSPDGRLVAYGWEPAGGRPIELRVAQSPDVAPRVLLRAEPGSTLLIQDWRRADRLLVESTSADGHVSLRVVDAVTGKSATIVTGTTNPAGAKLSPDGRFVAFDDWDGGNRTRDVVIVATGPGAAPVRIQAPSDDFAPVWSPSGLHVLFVSDRAGAPGLWAVPVREGKPVADPILLQRDIGIVVDLVGMTAGGALHYNRQVGLVDVQVLALDAAGRPSGLPRATRSTDVGGSLMPAFTPDGRRVTYASQSPGGGSLDHFDVASGAVRTIVTSLLYARVPRWSPDGRTLVVKGGSRDQRAGFFVVEPDSGRATPFVTVASNDETALGQGSWRHDGRFVLVRNPNRLVLVTPGADGEEPLATLDGVTRIPTLAPSPIDDRLALILVRGMMGALAVREADGRIRELVAFKAPEQVLSAAWMPDGRALLFSRRSDGNRPGALWRMPVDGDAPESLGIEAEGLRDLAVSPDARHIAFTAGYPRREPWVLEHMLPAVETGARPGAAVAPTRRR